MDKIAVIISDPKVMSRKTLILKKSCVAQPQIKTQLIKETTLPNYTKNQNMLHRWQYFKQQIW